MSETAVRWIVGIFSLLVGAAGWFYMFYSQAAQRLSVIESPMINHRRVLLRRIGGGLWILLAACFYIGCDALFRKEPVLFAVMMFIVLLLMAASLVLGLIDLRLTRKLRNRRDDDRP